jgi:LEA14-like dessication related protein
VKRLLLLIILLSGLCGCAAVAPQVRLQQIIPTGIDSDGLNVEVRLLVDNPNQLDLTLSGYSYSLQVAGLPFSSGEAQQATTFPGHTATLVALPTRIRHRELLELLKRQPDWNHIPYRLLAKLKIDTPLGESTIPLDHQGQLLIPAKYRPDAVIQRLKGLLAPL